MLNTAKAISNFQPTRPRRFVSGCLSCMARSHSLPSTLCVLSHLRVVPMTRALAPLPPGPLRPIPSPGVPCSAQPLCQGHLSQVRRSSSANRPCHTPHWEFVDGALNQTWQWRAMMSGLPFHKLWDNLPRSEVQSASQDPLPVGLICADRKVLCR